MHYCSLLYSTDLGRKMVKNVFGVWRNHVTSLFTLRVFRLYRWVISIKAYQSVYMFYGSSMLFFSHSPLFVRRSCKLRNQHRCAQFIRKPISSSKSSRHAVLQEPFPSSRLSLVHTTSVGQCGARVRAISRCAHRYHDARQSHVFGMKSWYLPLHSSDPGQFTENYPHDYH